MHSPTDGPLDSGPSFPISPTPFDPSTPPAAHAPAAPAQERTLDPSRVSGRTVPEDIPLTRDPLQIILAGLEPEERAGVAATMGHEWHIAALNEWQVELREDRDTARQLKGCLDYLCAHLAEKPGTETVIASLRKLANQAQNLTSVEVPNLVSIKDQINTIKSEINRTLSQLEDFTKKTLINRCGAICAQLATHGQMDKALIWVSLLPINDSEKNGVLSTILKQIVNMQNPTATFNEFIDKISTHFGIGKMEFLQKFFNDYIKPGSNTEQTIVLFNKVSALMTPEEKDHLAIHLTLASLDHNPQLARALANSMTDPNKMGEIILVSEKIKKFLENYPSSTGNHNISPEVLSIVNSIQDEQLKNEAVAYFIDKILEFMRRGPPLVSSTDQAMMMLLTRELSSLFSSKHLQDHREARIVDEESISFLKPPPLPGLSGERPNEDTKI